MIKSFKKIKTTKLLALVLLVLVTTITIAHAFIFPQQTRCMFLGVYNFEKQGNLYFRPGLDKITKLDLITKIAKAEKRVAEFWEENKSTPKYIYCDNDEDFKKFGATSKTPAVSHLKFGSYIVISKSGLNLNIISHELSHTELYERIGFFKRETQIPIWFDEGLAMQVDYRNYYSLDTLKIKSNNFKNLPKIKTMNSFSQFGKGTKEEVMLNFMSAKYEVSKWYTPKKLKSFIYKINNGMDFKIAY